MGSYMMMPKDYARQLMHIGQREKASAFMEYMFDLDEKKNNSIGFYALSWGKSKSTTHAWVSEFRNKISEFYDFWTIQNEIKHRTLTERSPNDFEKKPNAQSAINTGFQTEAPNALPNGSRTVAEQSINTINTKEQKKSKKEKQAPQENLDNKTILSMLPPFIDAETFLAYIDFRKGKKLPNTELVVKRLIGKCSTQRDNGNSIDEMIMKAITGGWRDFYLQDAKPKKQKGSELI